MGNTTPQGQLLPGSSSKRTSERFDIVEGDSAEYSPPTSPGGSGRSLMSSPPALGGVPVSHSAPLPSPRNRPKERETSSWFNFGTSPKSSAGADALLARPASPRVAVPSVAAAAPPSSPRVPSSSSFNAHRSGQPASPRVPASSSFSSSQRDLLVRTASAALTAPSGAAPLAPLQPGHSPAIPATHHARPSSSPPSPPVPASPPPSPPRHLHDSDADTQQQQQQQQLHQLAEARRPKKGASLTKLVFELESPEPLRVRPSLRDAAGNLAPATLQSAAELSAKIDRLFSGVHSVLIVDRELRVLYKDRVPDDSRDVVDVVSIFQRVRQTVDNLSQSLIELEEDWSVLHLRSGSQLFSAYSLRGSLFFLLFFAPHSPDDLVSADLSMKSICDQYTDLVLVDEPSDNDLSDY